MAGDLPHVMKGQIIWGSHKSCFLVIALMMTAKGVSAAVCSPNVCIKKLTHNPFIKQQ
ncbi:hypothetical protein SK128_025848 [Halocaridina rubra]|uniref:Uncharacterized protein n=1 Tax=Halocaridina rubra TaxID=373956 RepID=A0AAN8XGU2_HALRR